MGIESGPKWVPDEDSADDPKSPKQSGTDWSMVEEMMKDRREKELAQMSPEEREKALAEDERIRKQAESLSKWARGEEQTTPQSPDGEKALHDQEGKGLEKLDEGEQVPGKLAEALETPQEKLDRNLKKNLAELRNQAAEKQAKLQSEFEAQQKEHDKAIEEAKKRQRQAEEDLRNAGISGEQANALLNPKFQKNKGIFGKIIDWLS